MKKLFVIIALVGLTGCSTLVDMFPSRWDANQAKVTTDLRQATQNFDCKADQRAQLKTIADSAQWFALYSESKGTKDVANLGKTLQATVKEFQDRPQPVSPLYCDLKKKLMIQQADIIAKTVQGRF
jgi:dihydroorotase-like cyclic amidohydrolase